MALSTKPVGWDGELDLVHQLVEASYDKLLDIDTEYHIYVGKGGGESHYYHHYIVIQPAVLTDYIDNVYFIFELTGMGGKKQEGKRVIAGLRVVTNVERLTYKGTCNTNLR